MSEPRLRMDEFDYELPPSSIAHVPAEPRDAARLLVDRGSGEAPDHRTVGDLPSLLEPGDLLVVNETRVMPARLLLRKHTGGAAEVLLLAPLAPEPGSAVQVAGPGGERGWAALVRPVAGGARQPRRHRGDPVPGQLAEVPGRSILEQR